MKNESSIHILWPPVFVALIILYILSPIDLIPGAFIGLFDDLLAGILLVWFVTSWLPRNRHRVYWRKPVSQSGTAGSGADAARERAPQAGESSLDPFAVLNVRQGAPPNEVKHAYREMLMKYHPDRVNHLGKEFQQLAHDRVIEIKKAYDALCGKA